MSSQGNKIQRYDNFTKLEQVVLGRINFDLLQLIGDTDQKNYVEHQFHNAADTLDQLNDIFKKFDIKVHRPEPLPYTPDLTTPYATLPAVNNVLCPFDNYLILENTIVEAPSNNPYNYFDHMQYSHIWRQFSHAPNKWISTPRPSYNPDLENEEYLFDAPCFEPIGDTIFHTEHTCVTTTGLDWVKNYFSDFTYHAVPNTKGHLDGYFAVLQPGLIFSSIPKIMLPDAFKQWEVIESPKDNFIDRKMVNDFLQDDDYENTNLIVSSFNIDEHNIIMFDHVMDNHLDVVRKIEKHSINIIPVSMKSARFFGQGISCMTNAICRQGVKENYF